MQCVFFVWLISGLDEFLAIWRGKRPQLWTMLGVHSPYSWADAMHPVLYRSLQVSVSLLTGLQSYACLLAGDMPGSIMSTIGLLLFLSDGVANNPYLRATHHYADDQLRVVLPTSHHEGTVYVLPSIGRGLDAVWSSKVENEHTEADEQMMVLFQRIRSERWTLDEPLNRLRATMSAWFKRVAATSCEVRLLADWIYLGDDMQSALRRKMQAVRASGTHLIGRDLMFALCHAEYLVFMAQGLLPEATRSKLPMTRLMKRSGATAAKEGSPDTVGFKQGLVGYREAVRHVCSMFEEEVDESAINPQIGDPPAYSHALSKRPESLAEYAASLWDVSCHHSESTFTALYFFTLVWSMELGNVHGFHMFPVQCRSRDGDFNSQRIVWRQLWFLVITCQLVASSPILFGLFTAGFLT